MKNECEKEIENVDDRFKRNRRGRISVENTDQGSELQPTEQQQSEIITISRPHGYNKTRGNVYLYIWPGSLIPKI